MGWAKYSHEQIGINSFGASAPFKQVYAKFGLTPESTSLPLTPPPRHPSRPTPRAQKLTREPDIAAQSQKVVDFYKKAGHPMSSPLNKALFA